MGYIKMDLEDTRLEDVDWNIVAEDRDMLWAVLYAVLNIQIS
jgi:hypothetical protein